MVLVQIHFMGQTTTPLAYKNMHWQSREKYVPKFILGPLNKHEMSSLVNILSCW